jgi:hypothetical protein
MKRQFFKILLTYKNVSDIGLPVKTLHSGKELVWLSVVANSAMNRARNASGINSYQQEFTFQPQDALKMKSFC